jgi:hypothetical protein
MRRHRRRNLDVISGSSSRREMALPLISLWLLSFDFTLALLNPLEVCIPILLGPSEIKYLAPRNGDGPSLFAGPQMERSSKFKWSHCAIRYNSVDGQQTLLKGENIPYQAPRIFHSLD